MTTYVVRNWARFQHYRDRNPPWIKLHYELLSSADWVMLDDASRVLAIACMLVASRSEGKVDCSPRGLAFLKRVAYLNKNPNVKPLIECGFLEPASGCKRMQADARPEEETETETEEEEETEQTPVAQERDGSVDRVFDHWKTTHGHQKAALDDKRRKLIRDRLKKYSEADLCQAITGYLNSPHHMGQNDRDTKYDSIELFLRGAKEIDAGLKFYQQPPRTHLSAKTRQIIDATEDWQPPEMRRAAN